MSPVFGHGRLRLYLLKLLEESPKHGYEVIRLLQDRFLGVYAPSPGTIYPRLARLEEDGLVTHEEVDGRKVYRLTDDGRAELERRMDELADLEAEITASVRDIAQEVREDVRETVRSLRDELTYATREVRRADRARARETRTEAREAATEAREQARRAKAEWREDADRAREGSREDDARRAKADTWEEALRTDPEDSDRAGVAQGTAHPADEETPGAARNEATDTEATDAEATDTGATDTEATDAEATDTGATDTGAADAGATDTGATDTGATDAGAGRHAGGPQAWWERDWKRWAEDMAEDMAEWGDRWSSPAGPRLDLERALRDFTHDARRAIHEAGRTGAQAVDDLRAVLDETLHRLRTEILIHPDENAGPGPTENARPGPTEYARPEPAEDATPTADSDPDRDGTGDDGPGRRTAPGREDG